MTFGDMTFTIKTIMKYVALFLIGVLMTVFSFGQSITEVYFPKYIQGAGTLNTADEKRVPFAFRLRITGLNPNKTYKYYNRMVSDPTASGAGDGSFILVKQTGSFVRATLTSFTNTSRHSEFTTDPSGAYEGWFVNEPSAATTFFPGTTVYARISLNDGDGGTSVAHSLTTSSFATAINFGSTAGDGTGIRSTPATSGVAKNFVMLYDNEAGTGRPVAGTFMEADGTANTATNLYADFYATNVNEQDKTWGTIIPNNLAGGIRKIVQYSLTDGSEVGSKTSTDGNWAKDGGGTVSTVNTTGGITNVVVLNGSVVTLGAGTVLQPQTITFDPLAAKTYGDADFNPGATASSLLPVTYTSSNLAVATIINGNTIHIVGAGTTDITAEQSGNTDYSAATPVVRSLTVNPAALTITADDKEKVQGDPLPVFTVSYSGFVNGDDAGDLTTQPVASTAATAASLPGDYPITVGGATAANYTITHVPGNLKVTASKQQQTITFAPLAAKTYGDADFDPATASSGLQIAYSSSDPAVATVVNNKIHIVGAGTTTITASQAGDINYEAAADVSRSLTVNKASLTIKAENKSRLYGQPNPELTITYTGFVNNENNTHLTTQPTVSTTATTASQPGDYPVKVEGATAANYEITHVNGILTVSPLPAQTITFDVLPVKRYGDADFAAGATASSGLTVNYSSSNTSVATVVNGTIHVISAGTTNITASQPGDALNAPAPDVVRTLTVQKANLEIRALDTVKIEGETNPTLELVYSGFVNGETVNNLSSPPSVSTTATSSSLAGKYPIIVSGAASANYNIAQRNGTLTVLPAQGRLQDNMNAYLSSPGQLRVNIYSVEAGKAGIQLFDQHGTKVLQLNVTLVQGHNTYQLPVGNLIAGVYHVRVNGPGGYILKSKVVIR
jgi:hypothetical protein